MATTTWLAREVVEGDSRLASLDLEDLELDLGMVARVAEELGVAEVLEVETLEEEGVETLEGVMAWVDWEEVQDWVGAVTEV